MSEDYADIIEMRRAVPRSACPSLFRIVPAKDGGICRVKVPLGQISAPTLRAVAAAARRFGNGGIDATNRANFQIRGVAPANEPALIAALLATDLAPVRAESDDIRNVMVSPTAGIDPALGQGRGIDTQPIARALLDHLQSDADYGALSPKFGILVDGGEGVAVVDHPHDIWLAHVDGDRLALGFAGCPPVAADDTAPVATLAVADAVSVVAAAIRLFLDLSAQRRGVTRMRHLFAHLSPQAFVDRLAKTGLKLATDVDPAWRRAVPARSGHVGVHAQSRLGLVHIGAVPPLGRIASETLERLADIAGEYGSGELRFTPWQSVLLPSVPRALASAAVGALEAAGFACAPSHSFASLIACTGCAGCSAGLSDTKADALRLAQLIGSIDGTLHLTGCAKSCASAGVADMTLLATAPGRYTLHRKGGGDTFGHACAHDVAIDEIAALLRDEMHPMKGTG